MPPNFLGSACLGNGEVHFLGAHEVDSIIPDDDEYVSQLNVGSIPQ